MATPKSRLFRFNTLLSDDSDLYRHERVEKRTGLIIRWLFISVLVVATLVVLSVRLGMNIRGVSQESDNADVLTNNPACTVKPVCPMPSESPIPSSSPSETGTPMAFATRQPSNDPSPVPSNHFTTHPSYFLTNQPSTPPIVGMLPPPSPIFAPTKTPTRRPTSAVVPVQTMMPMTSLPISPIQIPISTMPITAPIEMPINVPIEMPINVPIEMPINAPIEMPINAPIEMPINAPIEMPINAPIEIPVTAPIQMPVTAPIQMPVTAPVRLPTAAPVPKPLSTPVGIPSGRIQVTTFYAIGDVPYTSGQAVELAEQMIQLPSDTEFVIHLGDLMNKKDDEPCLEVDYKSAADILRKSHAPVFVVLGDNDWNDCINRDEALGFWRKHFLKFESIHWTHSFEILRQPDRLENFAFVHKGSLFIGLNIVGGAVQSESEWNTRLTDQIEWSMDLIRTYASTMAPEIGRVVLFGQADPRTSHDAFFRPLQSFIATELKNTIPILYMNGDRHFWQYEPNFFGQSSFLRIMVTGQTVDLPLKVSVQANGAASSTEKAFAIDRRLA